MQINQHSSTKFNFQPAILLYDVQLTLQNFQLRWAFQMYDADGGGRIYDIFPMSLTFDYFDA